MIPAHGCTFIGLNIVRILSIITLLLVFSSSVVVMVHDIRAVNRFARQGNHSDPSALNDDYILDSTVPHQPAGLFWAVLNRLLIMGQTVVLVLSELGFPSRIFDKFFPVLGQDFGLGPLGLIQCLIGAAILSHHVDDFALVSAFFLFSVGCLNILIGLIWRESARAKRSVTSWRESKKDVLPKTLTPRPSLSSGRVMSPSLPSYHSTMKVSDEKAAYHDSEAAGGGRVGFGFGRQGEKAAANRGYLITRPVESVPRHVPKPSVNAMNSSGSTNPFLPLS